LNTPDIIQLRLTSSYVLLTRYTWFSQARAAAVAAVVAITGKRLNGSPSRYFRTLHTGFPAIPAPVNPLEVGPV
jgi:hypothetical protein